MNALLRCGAWMGCGVWLILTAAGCAHRPPDLSRRTADLASLQAALVGLDQSVSAEEARRAAECAYNGALELAEAYRLVRPPVYHNLLVNLGLRERGLCYQWADDLTARLRALDLKTLELHWGVARNETFREHNVVVLTAIGQPFEQGLVLDAWRHSGHLTWAPVAEDRYPWVEAWRQPVP